MFCKQCGKKIEIGAAQCPHCKRPTDPLSGGTGYFHLSSVAHSDPVAPQEAAAPQPVVSPHVVAPSQINAPVSRRPVMNGTPVPQPRTTRLPQLLSLVNTALSLILLIAVIVLSVKVSGLKSRVDELGEADDGISVAAPSVPDPLDHIAEAASAEEPPTVDETDPETEIPGEIPQPSPAEIEETTPEDPESGKLGQNDPSSELRKPFEDIGTVDGVIDENGDFTFEAQPSDSNFEDAPEYQWYVVTVEIGTTVVWDGEGTDGSNEKVISITEGVPRFDGNLAAEYTNFTEYKYEDYGNGPDIRIFNRDLVDEAGNGYDAGKAKFYFCRVTIGEDVYFTDLIQPLEKYGTITLTSDDSQSVLGEDQKAFIFKYNGDDYTLKLEPNEDTSLVEVLNPDGDLSFEWSPAQEERPELHDGDEVTLKIRIGEKLIFVQNWTTDQLPSKESLS